MAEYSSLKIKDLTDEQVAKFGNWTVDQLFRKHEAYIDGGDVVRRAREYEVGEYEFGIPEDFIDVGGHPVLLSHTPENVEDLRIDEWFISEDKRVITLFTTDMTIYEGEENEEFDLFGRCYFAIAYRVEGEHFYFSVIYHSRYPVTGPIKTARNKTQ